MPDRMYDYNEEGVYKVLNKDVKRKTVIYAHVSTSKQKDELQNRIQQVKRWRFMNGYTGKCSFPDNESIEHHEKYAGKRISPGTFRSANGMLIYADLHASYNIIKKTIPEAFANGIDGIGLYPGSLSIKEMITSKCEC